MRHIPNLSRLALSAVAGAAVVGSLAAASPASAQIPGVRLPKPPGGIKIPGLGRGLDAFLKEPPPVTTNLDDAVTEAPQLDSFEPRTVVPLADQPRTVGGGYYLAPGSNVYEMTQRSYCLKAGTYGPSRGHGHAYAPLRGPKAGIVRAILDVSARHPEIPQENVQVLLWAIIARHKFSDMPRGYQETAARLLNPKQLLELNGGALGVLAPDAQAKAFASLPGPVKQVLEAENKLRSMLTESVNAPYQELERVAVLAGVAPIEPGGRLVKEGRWSYVPDGGYFIRYAARGYATTTVQVYVPENFDVKLDRKGRLEGLKLGAAAGSSPSTLLAQPVQVAYAGPGLPLSSFVAARRKGPTLKQYNPSGGAAVPPGAGQRLGQSPLPKGNQPNRPNFNAINKGAKYFPKGPVVSIPGGGPLGMAATQLGFAIPRQLAQYIVDWNISTWTDATNALGGGDGGGGALADFGWYARACAAPEYQEIVRVTMPTIEPMTAQKGVTAAQAKVINEALTAFTDASLKLRALAASERRQKAALKAGDGTWAERQAQALLHYRHEAGVAMSLAARNMVALSEMLEAAGGDRFVVSAANVRAYHQRLRDKGFDAEEIKAAKMLGYSDQEIAAERQARLSVKPEDMAGVPVVKMRELAALITDLG